MSEAEAVVFDADEGDVASLVDVLLGHRRSARSTRFERITTVSPQLLRALCERVARACVYLLVQQGGARGRTVLRDGVRVHGRLFDADRAAAVSLEFSGATERFLTELAGRAQIFFTAASERPGKRFARDMLPADQGTRSGDWVFFALVDQHLDRVQVDVATNSALSARLRALSPLAALRAPHLARTTDARTLFGSLLTPGHAPILECVPDWLESAWSDALVRGLRVYRDHEGFCVHFEHAADALRAWLGLLDEANRLDLALPVARAVHALSAQLGAREDPRLFIRERANASSVAEGDRALKAVAACLSLVDQMALLRDLMGAQAYGDPRYDEAQIYLGDYDAHVAPTANAVLNMGRVVEGRLG